MIESTIESTFIALSESELTQRIAIEVKTLRSQTHLPQALAQAAVDGDGSDFDGDGSD